MNIITLQKREGGALTISKHTRSVMDATTAEEGGTAGTDYLVTALAVGIPCGVIIFVLLAVIAIVICAMVRSSVR